MLRLVVFIGFNLELEIFLRPAAFDIGQYCPDIVIGERVFPGGHVTLITFRCVRRNQSVLGDVKQHNIRMMPGVAGFIVGRGGHFAVGFGDVPVGLAFEVAAMAKGAKAFINKFAALDLLRIFRIGLACLCFGHNPIGCYTRQRNAYDCECVKQAACHRIVFNCVSLHCFALIMLFPYFTNLPMGGYA